MSGGTDDDSFLSVLYHALRARRRRETIRFVYTTDTPTIAVRTLGKNVAAVEQGLPPVRATGEPYRNAYNALSQTHLPTLADAGIINYDPERQTISPGPNLTLAALLVAISGSAVETLRAE
jgi:hypothetical protein